jgi:hypothetical protein
MSQNNISGSKKELDMKIWGSLFIAIVIMFIGFIIYISVKPLGFCDFNHSNDINL